MVLFSPQLPGSSFSRNKTECAMSDSELEDRFSESSSDVSIQDEREPRDGGESSLGQGQQQGITDFPREMLFAMKHNRPPDAAAVESALALKEEPERIVPELQKKLADIPIQMKNLKRMQAELLKEAEIQGAMLRGCNRVLTPLRRIPLEILREIAYHSIPDMPAGKINEAPLSLSHTTTAWRNVVLSSPELWSRLHVSLQDMQSLPRATQRIRFWFERAKARPVEFALRFPSPALYGAPFHLFLSGLSAVMPQVQHLSLSAPHILVFFSYFAPIDWPLSRLRSLSLSSTHENLFNPWGFTPIDESTVKMFKAAPNLQTVVVSDGFAFKPGGYWGSILPCARLTGVELVESMPIHDWARFMEVCEQLATGKFTIRGHRRWDTALDPGRPKYKHTILRTLVISFLDSDPSIVELLALFDFPELRSLDISHVEPVVVYAGPPAGSFFEFSNLHSLSLTNSIPATSVVAILSETTHLHTFKFTCDINTEADVVFKAMSLHQASVILPKLAIFEVTLRAAWGYFDMTAFVDMVKSRCGAVPSGYAPLQKLAMVNLAPSLLVELLVPLKSCRDAGLWIVE